MSVASVTVFIVASLAAANTSAGAPLTICWARSDEPPKLNLTVTPGWSVSNCLPSAVNDSVSDAAASTVSVCGAAAWLAGVDVPPPELPPQPVRNRADAAPIAASARIFTNFLRGSRR